MSQVQVPKLSSWVALGPPENVLAASKLSMWVVIVPGDDTGENVDRQSYVYGQRVTRG